MIRTTAGRGLSGQGEGNAKVRLIGFEGRAERPSMRLDLCWSYRASTGNQAGVSPGPGTAAGTNGSLSSLPSEPENLNRLRRWYGVAAATFCIRSVLDADRNRSRWAPRVRAAAINWDATTVGWFTRREASQLPHRGGYGAPAPGSSIKRNNSPMVRWASTGWRR